MLKSLKVMALAVLAVALLTPAFAQETPEEKPPVEEQPKAEAAAPAEQPDLEAEATLELAKRVQNPIAKLTSIGLRDDLSLNYGPEDDVLNVFDIIPVLPIQISQNTNLIWRTDIPVIHMPYPESVDGVGDINMSFYLAAARPAKLTWGAGPVVEFPTATNESIGTKKWSGGGGIVIVYTAKKWVAGGRVNNIWSLAGEKDKPAVNQMLLEPFFHYNLNGGWYFSFAPSITADWETSNTDNRWLIPLGGGVGKMFSWGKQKMNATAQAYYNVEKPEFGPDYSLRLQLGFLFPK